LPLRGLQDFRHRNNRTPGLSQRPGPLAPGGSLRTQGTLPPEERMRRQYHSHIVGSVFGTEARVSGETHHVEIARLAAGPAHATQLGQQSYLHLLIRRAI
jgi:hypothetical protein